MAVVATLTPVPVPSNTVNGEIPGTIINHVRIAAAGGAGTYNFAHSLQWTPLFAMVIPLLGQGTVPNSSNAATGFCAVDTGATNLAVSLPANGTYDVVFC